jgi:hypothetical protein
MARPPWQLLLEDPSDLTCPAWRALMIGYERRMASLTRATEARS